MCRDKRLDEDLYRTKRSQLNVMQIRIVYLVADPACTVMSTCKLLSCLFQIGTEKGKSALRRLYTLQ